MHRTSRFALATVCALAVFAVPGQRAAAQQAGAAAQA